MHDFSQSFSFTFPLIIFLTLTILVTPNNSTSTTNTNNYLLNCGAPTTAVDNKTWYTDEDPAFAPLATYKAATTTANATHEDPSSIGQLPCTAARLFHSPFTYSFPVTPGPKFIRLHFCASATYDTTTADHFFLSLQASAGDGGGGGSFTLLHNFSAYLHQQQFMDSFPGPISKEFLVMATTSRLKLTFSPTLAGSMAFINGIEIVSVPHGLYDYSNSTSVEDSERTSTLRSTPCLQATTFVGNDLAFSILGPTALETVARINVGGVDVLPENDSGNMSRTWYKDDNYLIGKFVGAIPNRTPMKIHYTTLVPEYTAPSIVYWTARVTGPYNDSFKLKNNLTWAFSVDTGFDYLVRLHLCEIDVNVTEANQREFDVFVNYQKAQIGVDVMSLANEMWASPVCKDYVASIDSASGEGAAGKAYLRLTLRPDVETHPLYHDVILNGLEIFKLNQSDGNLAGLNPVPLPDFLTQSSKPRGSPRDRSSAKMLIIGIVAGVLGSVVLISSVIMLVFRWWMNQPSINECRRLLHFNDSGTSNTSSGGSSLPSHLCHRFTLQQIKVATNNFDEDFIIGFGGFGKVYKASIVIDCGTEVMVAIKRLNPLSKQGAQEFYTEIEMLTALRHVHLVSLIGFCNENGEMILAYDYMPLGTLRDHLYRTNHTRDDTVVNNADYAPMPWKQRLMICIGAARGLHYLHTGTNRLIIHRDVKSTNILLDENWTAKVSDFGISKAGPLAKDGGSTYISTLVKGSLGYLDPEYLRLNQLTEKSDVYSFGVVLFEVLCARPAMVSTLPSKQVNLAMYAKRCYKEDHLNEIVDPNVKGEITPECLRKFGEIAVMCVHDHGSKRPSMEEVVWYLEFALQLQQNAEENEIIIPSGVDKNGDKTRKDSEFTTS